MLYTKVRYSGSGFERFAGLVVSTALTHGVHRLGAMERQAMTNEARYSIERGRICWFPPLITVIICYLGHSMIKKILCLGGRCAGDLSKTKRRQLACSCLLGIAAGSFFAQKHFLRFRCTLFVASSKHLTCVMHMYRLV